MKRRLGMWPLGPRPGAGRREPSVTAMGAWAELPPGTAPAAGRAAPLVGRWDASPPRLRSRLALWAKKGVPEIMVSVECNGPRE